MIVWNDPINLMSYVTYVFQKLFGYSRDKATKLMLEVHHEGQAVVSGGNREKAECDVSRLHAHGLWATIGAKLTMALKPRIRRSRKGEFVLNIPSEERDALRSLPGQLRELLATDNPALERLFPPAYPTTSRLGGLCQHHARRPARHQAHLDRGHGTNDRAPRPVDEEQLLAWLGSINDLRLVFGTRLGVAGDETNDRCAAGGSPRVRLRALRVSRMAGGASRRALAAGIDPRGVGHQSGDLEAR